MNIQINKSDDQLVITLAEERSFSRWLSFVWALLISAIVVTYFYVAVTGWARYCVAIAFAAVVTFISLRNLIGVDEVRISPQTFELVRRVGPFRSRRQFNRPEVEWIAFSPEFHGYNSHQDSGIAMLVRADVTPILFARTITEAEASHFLDELAHEATWIGPLIRPIGQPAF